MEELIQPLDLFPLWLIFIFTLAFLFLAPELGFRLGMLIQVRWPDRTESGRGQLSARGWPCWAYYWHMSPTLRLEFTMKGFSWLLQKLPLSNRATHFPQYQTSQPGI